MTSYGEIAVDQNINDGWKTFRTRLADHLVSDADHPPIDLVPADHDAGVLVLTDPAGCICVVAVVDQPGTAGTRTLRELGFRKVEANDAWQVSVERRYADRAAHAVYVVLHELLHVIHPSLLDTDPVGLDLWDELADETAAPIVLPALAFPNDPDGLQALVDETMAQEFGHPPYKDDDGDIPVRTDEGGTAYISARGDFAVEVWTILAHDVNRPKARRAMVRLSLKYPLHKFHLKGRTLIASLPLFAHPFVPELLTAAVGGTLHVSAREHERLTRRLQRAHPPKRRCTSADEGGDGLRLIFDEDDASASRSARDRDES